MRIAAKEYIDNGYSKMDIELISPAISNILNSNKQTELDFGGVKYFTTYFFNHIIGCFMNKMSIVEYNQYVRVYSLSESVKETYKQALNYALEYYNNSRKN